MNPNHAYATARQLIDPTLTTPSTSAPTTAGHSPPTPVTGNYPAWTSSWPPAGSLRPRPAGHVQSTSPDTLDIRTGDGRLRLRFTAASSSVGRAPGDPASGDRFG